MSSGEKKSLGKTLFAQIASIMKVLVDEKRDLGMVIKALQGITKKNFFCDDLHQEFLLQLELIMKLARNNQVLARKIIEQLQIVIEKGRIEVNQDAGSLLALIGAFTLLAKRRKRVEIVALLEGLGLHCYQSFNHCFGGIKVGGNKSSTLSYYSLNRKAKDNEILSARGGEKKCEITPEEFVALVERQLSGEKIFLDNGSANIFYIRRTPASALCAVCVGWDGYRWCVDAYALDSYYDFWSSLRRVFSRNS